MSGCRTSQRSRVPAGNAAAGLRWLARLAAAKTQAEVLGLCRRYLSSMAAADRARLPIACRPIPIEDATDLSAYALQLVRYHCAVEDAPAIVLRMATFFAHANVRMAQLLRPVSNHAVADKILAEPGRRALPA